MYSYTVKVRTEAYLWGSAGVAAELADPLLLVIHNDAFGDPVAISSNSASGNTALGTLQPGECWTVGLL